MRPDYYKHDVTADGAELKLQGHWTNSFAQDLIAVTEELDQVHVDTTITVRCGGLQSMDLTGAWLLHKLTRGWQEKGIQVDLTGFKQEHAKFIHRIAVIGDENAKKSTYKRPFRFSLLRRFRDLVVAIQVHLFFFRDIVWHLASNIRHPKQFRLASITKQIEETTIAAFPIIVVMAALIAIVLAYQGSLQLEKFGAKIYTVELVGISILREMGVLLTAIMVAGRSGSAFAAELGVMRLNEETDALLTMGRDPIEILVLPRIIALLIALPVLTLVANLAGLIFGALLAPIILGIEIQQFAVRVSEEVPIIHFWVGMIKAPVFALLIAVTSCMRGLQVRNSAEQVGQMTTRAVVESIFLVLIADAAFSVLFGEIGWV